ncbi:prolyl oligopeptidase family serine peptidase [Parahaliea aestuarii]|uniref:S9 family peptidase n=1 Tax=Parahaliea aestuarii TaxID=1852021 RepID=A0A5C9A244_9GAMM|nr:prolyl oligopeptidase family serine peptidase [Parahaliea aestuarii]TXS94925.1 S9 family peptidase [Parahaliea aestuarii]
MRGFLRCLQNAAIACVYTSAVVAGAASAAEDNLPPLSLERVFDTPSLFGTPPAMPVWSADSEHLAFIWAEPGQTRSGLWLVGRDGAGLRQLGDNLPAESAPVREIAWLPDAKSLVSLRGDSLWLSTLSGDDRLLADELPGASHLAVAPGGKRVSWLRQGDLWMLDLSTGKVTALTNVGIAPLSALAAGRYRRPEREVGSGIWGGPTYQWSPDGNHVALHIVDRRGMRKVSFPDYLAPEDTSPNFVRRGYPGDPNESRSVGLLHIESGELTLLDLRDTTANQVVSFDWSPAGRLLLDVASDTAVERWLYTADPGQSALREVWHHRRSSRIYTRFGARWSADGSRILFLSDRENYYGIYALDPGVANAAPQRLSDPGFDALAAPEVVAETGAVFFHATAGQPAVRHLYRADGIGQPATRLTRRPGHHDGYPAPDGRSLALISSDDQHPPELYIGAASGEGLRRVTHSPLPEFGQRQWARARYVTFPSHIDDYTLQARILEPPKLKPGHRYPVLFGPIYSNTVRNRWAGVYTRVQQLLVQLGYIVVQVDVRGSTGYGRDFREEFLTDFAGGDIEDVVSAVDYMRTLPHVDPQRLGIWGSSYGGTMTVYTLLSKPGLFCAGVAGASAVDPAYFGTDDVAIVRTPDVEPDIFSRRAEALAGNLEDHLMLIHGMQDQVVPFRTIAALAEALIREGKNFDAVFVPGATHAWRDETPYSAFLFGKLIEHFDRYLKSGDCR